MSNGAPIVAAVAPGTVLTYTIKVPNAGDANATNVVVTDPIDPNLDQVTAQNGGTLNGTTITWNLGGITTGASATVTFTARVKLLTANGTVISNQASVTSSEITVPQLSDDPSTAAAHDPTLVTVNSKPDLSTSTKTVAVQNQIAPGVLRPGDSLLYTISVINTGNTFADNVVVTDPLDHRSQPIRCIESGRPGLREQRHHLEFVDDRCARARRARSRRRGHAQLHRDGDRGPAVDGDVISNQGQLSCDEVGGFVTDDPSDDDRARPDQDHRALPGADDGEGGPRRGSARRRNDPSRRLRRLHHHASRTPAASRRPTSPSTIRSIRTSTR